MLDELLQAYIKAKNSANLKEMVRIEKQLNSVGMDSATIRVLIKEREKEAV